VLILFTVTIFLGALLLFLVQPLVGRMLLPLLGGAPAVWNTVLVFFQAALLAGYGYAHLSTRWLGVRRQVWLHWVVMLMPLTVLPISVPAGWEPPAAGHPLGWLLATLAVVVGAPFFVVAATSPLLQRWLAASRHPQARDPYFLYAASNAGSLLALVAYPTLIEPRWRLAEQSWWWAAGYGVLVLLMTGCGLWVRPAQSAAEPVATAAAIPWRRRGRWVMLALVPCSLMLSVTTYLTADLAPIPLLWVLPLGLYLLTFVLVFARRQLVPHQWVVAAVPVVVAVLLTLLLSHELEPLWLVLGMPLVGLFVVALACHGELAADRPPAAQLTEFYFWLSAGGVLGGVFNALLAPVVFRTVLEYPLTLLAACWVLAGRPTGRSTLALDLAWAVAAGLVAVNLNQRLGPALTNEFTWRNAVVYGVPPLACLALWSRPRRFALALGAVLAVHTLLPTCADRILHEARSFFGVYRVSRSPSGQFHWLVHGSTIHGAQSCVDGYRREPLSYYTRRGPLGQAWSALPDRLKQHVAVVGLGAGGVSCYAAAGQRWTFYEIDPLVERLARDPRYFTFLRDCPAAVRVVLGDARLSLAQARDGEFGLMILDAYTSDAIPVHLLTREALALYRRKLTADGVLLFHISHRHLRLERVLGALAQDAGLACRVAAGAAPVEDEPLAEGMFASKWMVLAGDPATLAQWQNLPDWETPPPRLKTRPWTDDYASVFSVFRWR